MSGTFVPTATRASQKVAYFATVGGINTSSITTNTVTANSILTSSINSQVMTIAGDSNATGISMINNANIIFADGATIGANSMAIANFDTSISTINGVKTPLSIYDYGSGLNGFTQVGGLIVSGSAVTSSSTGNFSVIDGDASRNMALYGSTITLQGDKVNFPNAGRTLVSTGSPVPSVTLTSNATVGNVNFGGSVGQFITAVTGGTYTLQGAIAVTASAGLTTPFTVNVVCTDGVNPGTNYPVYSGISTAPYATGTGSMASVYVPITTTLKTDFNKISVSASCPGLTGAQTLTVDMGAVTLVRTL